MLEKKEMEKMKIRPLQDRLIVKRIEEEEKTKGESSSPTRPRKSPRRQGDRGWQRKDKRAREADPLDVKRATGSFWQVCRHRVKIDGEEHLIMREEDILGIIE